MFGVGRYPHPPCGALPKASLISPFDISGPVVVTGGNGQIGRALVAGLLSLDVPVISLDIGEPTVERKSALFTSRVTDLTNLTGLDWMVAGLPTFTGWVNCHYPRPSGWGTKGKESPAVWQGTVYDHLVSYCLLSQFAAEAMAERGGGSLVNVGSIYGLVGPDDALYAGTDMTMPAPYAAIKGGIDAYSRLLAVRMGKAQVRINTVAPGGVDGQQDHRFKRRYAVRTPLGRMARADEVVAPILFLLSQGASYVTGTTLIVDGGWTAR